MNYFPFSLATWPCLTRPPCVCAFSMEVEEYKRLPRSEFLKSRSRKIINKFIKENANSPITISPEARQQAIERSLDPSPQTFQLAQQEVCSFFTRSLETTFFLSIPDVVIYLSNYIHICI